MHAAPDVASDNGSRKVAIVTGANRGIGLAIVRGLAAKGLDVVIGARDPDRGREAAQTLRDAGVEVRVEELDVSSDRSVRRCAERLGPVDVLVNNAGVHLVDRDVWDPLELEDAVLEDILQTNLYGPLRTIRAWMPGMIARSHGRVVNVSSVAARFATMPANSLGGYVLSKTALNALTHLASIYAPESVKINCMCPGWVQSDMGYAAEGTPPRTLEQGADTAIWLATLPDDGPTGSMFIDRERVSW